MNDEQLLQELAAGRAGAMETIVRRYHGPIYAYLYRLLGSKPMAEDLTQECFIRVMESARRNRLPDMFRPWLYKIAANLCHDAWRKPSYRFEWVNDDALKELPSDQTAASRLEQEAEREAVIQAVGRLSPDKRNLIVLRFYQELKLEEIAAVLDIPLSTVKWRLYQSYKDLQLLLDEEAAGHPDKGKKSRNRKVSEMGVGAGSTEKASRSTDAMSAKYESLSRGESFS